MSITDVFSDTLFSTTHDQAFTEFSIGAQLLRRNQMTEALDRFRRVIVLDSRRMPDVFIFLYKRLNVHFLNMPLRLLIAELYAHFRLYPQALSELEEAVDLDPDYVPFYMVLSKIYKYCTDTKTVQRLFEQAFDKGLRDTAILDLLPKIYLEEAHFDKGIHFYESLIETDPLWHHYKALLAFYDHAGDYLKAGKLYQKMAEESPEETVILANACEQMLLKSDDNGELRLILVDLYIKAFHPLKSVLHIELLVRKEQMNRQDAIQKLRDILALFPNTHDILVYLSDLLIQEALFSEAVSFLQLAAEHRSSDDELVAIERLLKRVLRLYPEQVMALQLLSDLTYKRGQFEECLGYLSQLLDVESAELSVLETKLQSIMLSSPHLALECRMGLARMALKKGEFSQATREAMHLRKSEHDLRACFLLADISLAQNQPDKALSFLLDALQDHAESWDVHERIRVFHEQRLLSQYEVLSQPPLSGKYSADHLLKLGTLELYRGDFYKAMDCYQKIDADSPYFFDAQMLISRCFMEMGRYDLSANQLTRVHQQLEPHIPIQNRVRFLLSLNHLNMGEPALAMSFLEKIMEYDVNYPQVQSLISRKKNENFLDFRGVLLGGCPSASGEITIISIQNLENESYSSHTMSMAHPHNHNGVNHLLKRNIKTAEEEFKLSLQLDEGFTASYCNLAVLHTLKKEYDVALSYLDKASELNHRLDGISLNKGLIYLLQEDLDHAQAQFEQAFVIHPHNALVLYNLGEVYFRKHRLTDAMRYWRQAAALGNVFHVLHRRLWYLCEQPEKISHWSESFSLEFLKGHFLS
jgi:tetratricopeptide (TPR) repeat protein